MSDYDPKSIPILDDVIKIEETDNTDIDDQEGEPALFETTPVEAENNLDLFVAESINASASTVVTEDVPGEGSLSEDTEPQIGIIDEFIAEDSSHTIDITTAEDAIIENSIPVTANDTTAETDESESALISYNTDTEKSGTVSDTTSDIEAINIAAVDVEPQSAEQPEPPASLKSMVDDITKELMPDLEQQLRYLIQQALEDRLPDEVIEQLIENKEKLY